MQWRSSQPPASIKITADYLKGGVPQDQYSDSLIAFQDMHHRTPSAFTRKVGSNVRRRSGGATSLKNRADRAPADEDDSFPSIHSQPTVTFMSRGDRSARSTVNLDASSARLQRDMPPTLPRFEGKWKCVTSYIFADLDRSRLSCIHEPVYVGWS